MSSKPSTSTMDFRNILCLACSSSLPPYKSYQIFKTNCCSKPICPTCLSSNPRLARYDPCLACLGGVGALSAGSSGAKHVSSQNINVDGAVRDEDTFILGDDEDEDEGEDTNKISDRHGSSSPPPPYSSELPVNQPGPSTPIIPQEFQTCTEEAAGPSTETSTPSKYYIKPNDNLKGIALRFGVDGRELCRLNNLPPSTISTTPHILHTRAFLILPPSVRSKSKLLVDSTQDTEREARLARERAEKRLQTLTKEVDWRVAKAYVALADDPDVDADMKGKESSIREDGDNIPEGSQGDLRTEQTLEGRAVTRYLDDEEWEERERRDGRIVAIQPFPYSTNGEQLQIAGGGKGANGRSFWRW